MYKIFILTDDEIEQQSVLKATVQEDLISPKLGSTSKQQICQTCGNTFPTCIGHNGYIQTFWYYMPLLQNKIVSLLSKICTNCLLYNKQPKGSGLVKQCEHCLEQLNTIQPIYVEKALIGFKVDRATCIRLQKQFVINQKQMINITSKEIILHPVFVQKILEKIVIQNDSISLNEAPTNADNQDNQPTNNQDNNETGLNIDNSALLQFVHRNVPVVSQQFRVSQIELGEINYMNMVYSKLFRYQLTLQDIQDQSKDMISLTFKDTLQQRIFAQFNVTIYLLMSNNFDASLQQFIGLQSTNQAISLLSRATPKKGFFRNNMNGIRVNKSARTVVGGDPYLKCDELTCPQYVAENITIPVQVNVQNLSHIKKLVEKFPEYPCAKYFISQRDVEKNIEMIKINPSNKQAIIELLQPGDIIYRQVLNGDTTLTNRYPSIAEESFGMHKVVLKEAKQIQFNMSVIDKMTADFDGDEMQLFFPYNWRSRIENICLQSIPRQFISYEDGLNIIGGAKDLKVGIFNLQQHFDLFEDQLNAIIPKNLKDYDNGKIVIEKGKFKKISTDLANAKSKFLTQIAKEYTSVESMRLIDNVLDICYYANEICGSTLYTNIFDVNKASIDKYTIEQRNQQLDLIEKFYTGKFNTPIGIDPVQYFESYLIISQSYQTFIQMDILMQQLQIQDPNYPKKDQYYNQAIEGSFSDQMRACCIYDGQKKNADGTRITNPIRVFPCFKKFDFRPETQGFVYNCFGTGLDNTSTFFENIEGRKQLYDKTNSTPDAGYFSRRVSKGLDAVYMGFDGVVMSQQIVLNLGYGVGNYDPRYNAVKSMDAFLKMPTSQLKEHFAHLSTELRDDAIKYISEYKRYWNSTLSFPASKYEPKMVAPFEWNRPITEDDLKFILTYNVCDNQSDLLKQSLLIKNRNLYNYFLLFGDVQANKKSTKSTSSKSTSKKLSPESEIFRKLVITSNCPAGEAIGGKAALSFGRPMTQAVLHAIHKKAGKNGQVIKLQEFTRSKRLKSLVDHTASPIVFGCKLLDGYTTEDFINKYQTFYLSELEPSYQYFIHNKLFVLEISLPIDILAHYDINIKSVIEQLQLNYVKFGIRLENADRQEKASKEASKQANQQKVVLTYGFDVNIIDQIDQIKQSVFGSNIIFNLYEDDGYIYGNIKNPQDIYYFKEVDPDTIYLSEPDIPSFGVFYQRNKLYKELLKVSELTDDIAHLQKTHIHIMSNQLTIDGSYRAFSRNTYKHLDSRNLIQNIIYEEGTYFIQQQLLNERTNDMMDPVSSQIFGTQACYGTNISVIEMEV